MIFFTWNLKHNVDALELACQHLARLGTCVAAFQEPPDIGAGQIEQWSGSKLKLLTRSVPIPSTRNVGEAVPAKVIFVVSDDLSVAVRHKYDLDSNRRLEGIALLSGAGKSFQVLGIHARDLVNHGTEGERNEEARALRCFVDNFWSGGPFVVLGDLQANPFDWFVTRRTSLHALRKKDWPRSRLKPYGSDQGVRALYNPMWSLLSDQSATPNGTYHYRSKETDLSWHCIDQIIVSSDLEPHLGALEILSSLRDANSKDRVLVTECGLPDDERYSDHLPVQLVIDLDKV